MQAQPLTEVTVAGVMTGTSADGIDVAVCRCRGTTAADLQARLIEHTSAPLPDDIGQLVRQAATSLDGAAYARLEWTLSASIADVLRRISGRTPFDLAAVHGQTIWHAPSPCPTPFTHQVLDPHRIALAIERPVIWDFRRADVAAGGQGAPLAPVGHAVLFRQEDRSVAVLNVGGIANVTLLAGADGTIRAWDTGPGMMVCDALARRLLQRPFDPEGRYAASGTPIEAIVEDLLQDAWFTRHPPRSAGREQFGQTFVERLCTHPAAAGATPADLLRTAVSITARAAADSLRTTDVDELILCGGGAHNRMLRDELPRLMPETRIRMSSELGIPVSAVEPVCFAILGALRYHDAPLDLTSITGASRPLLYGQLCHAAGM